MKQGKMHFLITAGGTREYIDPVRFISNASSGKMGYALARAALRAGHKVTLITAPTSQPVPGGIKVVKAGTAAQMFEAVKRYFSRCDCLIMAAAVTDYAPVRAARTKIKKQKKVLNIKLKATRDILKWAGKHKRMGQVVVGFALEDKQVRARAEWKLKEKNLDIVVVNTPAAICADKASVEIKTARARWVKFPRAAKAAIAKRIVALIEDMQTKKGG
jgi:phosphopantothenoylcysteine decarboxylase/phosphopantothenate--cysteine ligase